MSRARWDVPAAAPIQFRDSFAELSAVTAQLLWNRSITDQHAVDEFFAPDYQNDIHDPYLLSSMTEAVDRAESALAKHEKIVIYSDYDADAVTGAAVLVRGLKALGATVSNYIPERLSEGYGLNTRAVQKIFAGGARLMITVDCGITAVEEIGEAQRLGMDVIVTDHHHVPQIIPAALAVVNAKQPYDQYPFKELTGVAVAFKFIQALYRRVGATKGLVPGVEKWLLDLVAIGTLADCGELRGENRTLVHYGLIVLAKSKNVGLRALLQKARVQQVDTQAVSFQLAPRINVAGRLSHGDLAFRLLTTDSAVEAEKLANELESLNNKRRSLTDTILTEAKASMGETVPPVIFAAKETWSQGVIGIVAGRLSEEYSRPCLILERGQTTSKGSARSVASFNIIEALHESEDILLEFGGHPQAAGFSVLNIHLDTLRMRLEEKAVEARVPNEQQRVHTVDMEVIPSEINWNLYSDVAAFAPFGEGNNEPRFVSRNFTVENSRLVGAQKQHIQFDLSYNAHHFKAVAFKALTEWFDIKPGDRIDILYTLLSDSWNGTKELKLRIIDIKRAV